MRKNTRYAIIILIVLLLISLGINVYLIHEKTKVFTGYPDSYYESTASYLYSLPAEKNIVYADSIWGFPAKFSFTDNNISIQSSEMEALVAAKEVDFFAYQGQLGVRLIFTCVTQDDAQQLLKLIAKAPREIQVQLAGEDALYFGFAVHEYDLEVPPYQQ